MVKGLLMHRNKKFEKTEKEMNMNRKTFCIVETFRCYLKFLAELISRVKNIFLFTLPVIPFSVSQHTLVIHNTLVRNFHICQQLVFLLKETG